AVGCNGSSLPARRLPRPVAATAHSANSLARLHCCQLIASHFLPRNSHDRERSSARPLPTRRLLILPARGAAHPGNFRPAFRTEGFHSALSAFAAHFAHHLQNVAACHSDTMLTA